MLNTSHHTQVGLVDFYASLEIAIIRDYDDIFYYIVDNFCYPTDKNDISLLLNEASKKKSPKYFNYIENKYNRDEEIMENSYGNAD